MQKIFIFIYLLAMSTLLKAQSCHSVTPNQEASVEFTALGKNKTFRNAHELPATRKNAAELKGRMITFSVGEEQAEGNAYLVKATSATNKYLLVFHEWWGLNDHIKAEADRLSTALDGKVHVLAIDLYDGKVATTRNAAAELMGMAKKERCKALIQAAMTYAGDKARFATIGWCFGGGWSVQASILAGERSWGCVMFYGMPEKEVNRLKKLNTDVLAIYAEKDQWITREVAEEFEANMEAAGKEVTSLHYDANHAFCNPSSPRYVREAAKAANSKALDYLSAHLKP